MATAQERVINRANEMCEKRGCTFAHASNEVLRMDPQLRKEFTEERRQEIRALPTTGDGPRPLETPAPRAPTAPSTTSATVAETNYLDAAAELQQKHGITWEAATALVKSERPEIFGAMIRARYGTHAAPPAAEPEERSGTLSRNASPVLGVTAPEQFMGWAITPPAVRRLRAAVRDTSEKEGISYEDALTRVWRETPALVAAARRSA